VASSVAECAVTACAPTFAASRRALRSDRGKSRGNDLGNAEAGIAQRHGQKSREAAGPDDGDGGLPEGFLVLGIGSLVIDIATE